MRPIAALAIILVVAGCSRTADEVPEATRPAALVSIGPIEPLSVAAGDRVAIRVPVRVADGYHVQANPAAGEFLIPLEVTLGGAEGVVPGAPGYPPGHRYRLQGMEDDLLTYEGEVVLSVPVDVDEAARPGARTLEGAVRYQACDRKRCFAPATVGFDVAVEILP